MHQKAVRAFLYSALRYLGCFLKILLSEEVRFADFSILDSNEGGIIQT